MPGPDGVALVPTPPLQVPALSPTQPHQLADEVEHLRAITHEALLKLPPADVAVVVVAGDAWRPGRSGPTTLDGFGAAGVDRPVAFDAATAAALGPGDDLTPLDTSASVLIWLVAEYLGVPQVVVEVDRAAAADTTLEKVRTVLDGAFDDRRWVAVCAGDLATTLTLTSAGYLVEGATQDEDRFVAAVRDRDQDAIAAWGPELAARVRAPGWASAAVGVDLTRWGELDLEVLAHTRVKGIGGIVAVTS